MSQTLVRTLASALLFMMTLGLAGCGGGGVPLYHPPKSSFQPLPETRVEAAIFQACLKRGWIPSKKAPGLVEATLHLREHTLVVQISYGDDNYKISYLDSERLDYRKRDDGRETIHKNANTWIKHLSVDIGTALNPPPATLPAPR